MQLELSNDLEWFYQWDVNQTITVPAGIPQVDFKLGDIAVSVKTSNRVAEIPDECFQSGEDLILWAYQTDHTIDAAKIPVKGRPKPLDYVYTPTETKMWSTITDRMSEIEASIASIDQWTSDAKKAAQTATEKADEVSAALVNGVKNPFALTIKIGDTTTVYDGSSAQTVEITDGTGVSY